MNFRLIVATSYIVCLIRSRNGVSQLANSSERNGRSEYNYAALATAATAETTSSDLGIDQATYPLMCSTPDYEEGQSGSLRRIRFKREHQLEAQPVSLVSPKSYMEVSPVLFEYGMTIGLLYNSQPSKTMRPRRDSHHQRTACAQAHKELYAFVATLSSTQKRHNRVLDTFRTGCI